MAPQIILHKDANITLPLPVAANTVKDTVVLLGTTGLRGYTRTDRATTAKIAAGTATPGLADGQASVTLIGISIVASLAIANAITQFDKVYLTSGGVYTATSTSNTFIGYALDTLTGAGNARVALIASGF